MKYVFNEMALFSHETAFKEKLGGKGKQGPIPPIKLRILIAQNASYEATILSIPLTSPSPCAQSHRSCASG